MKRLLHILFFAALLTSSLQAKKATIKWKTVRGAKRYDIQIKLDDKVIVSRKLKEGSKRWVGTLEPGLYYYRIRVIDRIERAGHWSKYHPLVVKPEGTEGLSSAQDLWTDEDGGVELKWDPIPNVSEYQVTITRWEDEVILRKKIKGNTLYVPKLDPGEGYMWMVQGILKAGKRVPASIQGIEATGDASEPQVLVVRTEPPLHKWELRGYGNASFYNLERSNQINNVGWEAGASARRTLSGVFGMVFQFNASLLTVSGTNWFLPEPSVLGEVFFDRNRNGSKWGISLAGGIKMRQMLRVNENTNLTKYSNVGWATRLEILRNLSRRTQLGIYFDHYLPVVTIFQQENEALDGINLLKNYSVELMGRYRINKNFAGELGVGYYERGAKFTNGFTPRRNAFYIASRLVLYQ